MSVQQYLEKAREEFNHRWNESPKVRTNDLLWDYFSHFV